MTKACEIMEISTQYYYKRLQLEKAHLSDIKIIEDELRNVRRDHPNIGVKKFFQGYFPSIRPLLHCSWGQHKVMALARRKGWYIPKKKSYTRTTDSYHHYRVHRNLIKDLEDIAPGEVLVSDITYLRMGQKFVYLSLITDLGSRKIVDWNLSESLAAEGALEALNQVRKVLNNTENVIHHSDRGIQYCCGHYNKKLQDLKMKVSMTEENHCYENSVAERVNGILKMEYNLGDYLPSDLSIVKKIVKDAIDKYNSKRKHWSLNLKTPDEVFYQNIK